MSTVSKSDRLTTEVETAILAYNERKCSAWQIAELLGLHIRTVEAVIQRGIPTVRYMTASGGWTTIPVDQTNKKPKVTRCRKCGRLINTNYCLICVTEDERERRKNAAVD